MTRYPDLDTIDIPLRRKDGTVCAHAFIDPEDVEQANHKWYRLSSGYVVRVVQRQNIRKMFYLHREILGLVAGDGVEADHINGNRLDNRRSNLRAVTPGQNQQNRPSQPGSSQYRGVSWNQRDKRWMAFVQLDRKTHYLGSFMVETEAAIAAKNFRLTHMTHTTER